MHAFQASAKLIKILKTQIFGGSMDKFLEAYLIVEEAIDSRSLEPLKTASLSTLLAISALQCIALALLLCTNSKGRSWVSTCSHHFPPLHLTQAQRVQIQTPHTVLTKSLQEIVVCRLSDLIRRGALRIGVRSGISSSVCAEVIMFILAGLHGGGNDPCIRSDSAPAGYCVRPAAR